MTGVETLLYLPVGITVLGFALTLLCRSKVLAQKCVTLVSAMLYLGVCTLLLQSALLAPFALVFGGWALPFGVSFGCDAVSAALLVVTGLIFFATALYSQTDHNAERSQYYFPSLNIIIAGVSGAFLARDLFNLYVWFEVILISSFCVLALEQQKLRLSGSLKYVVLNLLSSALFLTAAGLLYNRVHTLDFAEATVRLAHLKNTGTSPSDLNMLFFVAFAVKAAIFPFHFWLPATYHHLSPAISALFAGLLTKVGIYAIVRVCLITFPRTTAIEEALALLAPLSILIGVFGAISQTNIRRILGFHIVSQIGYLSTAALFISADHPTVRYTGVVALVFYTIHHIVVKSNLYFVSGLVRQIAATESLAKLGGFAKSSPWLLLLFAAPALSLIGVPPTSGFWAKFALIKIAITHEYFFQAAVMVIGGFFTAYSMIKIWIGAFYGIETKASPDTTLRRASLVCPILACMLLSAFSIAVGLFPDVLMKIAIVSADQLISVKGG